MTKRDWLSLAFFLVLSLGGGLFIGATNLPGAWYAGLEKPAFTPPDWLFAPAWTILYVLIGIAGWRIWRARAAETPGAGAAMAAWAAQMALNLSWSPVVFTVHSLATGLAIIIALLLAIVAFIGRGAPVDRLAAALFVPYAAWVAFATALNAGLLFLN
ncbi:TspO/MBR family protein [Breoghania sp. L-A4]|uniref:TspO/MBR family protein n=1 Tax=Breoghania sp. L-A4 TaxID=2304600 RepID=UPI000E35C18D|nr:TspO/MBR family protein [Breoghania sp. L-A4]AXS38840.1 tryptophan-rich sensory protein [Breoghania sp. L-A4]